MKNIFTLILAVVAVCSLAGAVLAFVQEPGQPVEVPTNFIVWGGLSITTLFTLIVTGLRAIGVIKDGTPVKKSIGVYLAILGALTGGVYAYQQDMTVFVIVTLAAGGALAGLASVGFHSTQKNFKERNEAIS